MIETVPGSPIFTPTARWPHWMTGHRVAGALGLGVALGLAWGAMAGVVGATLIGYGTLSVMRVALPSGILVVGLPAMVLTYRSLKPVSQSRPYRSR